MDALWQDVRLGLRALFKSPLFTAAVVLTLGLGIGANAAVFSIVNRLLLRPLPVRDPGGLQVLTVGHEGNLSPHNVSWLDYEDYRANPVFQDLAAYDIGFVGLAPTSAPSGSLSATSRTISFRCSACRRRSAGCCSRAKGRPGADPVLVLGHSYWRRRFNEDPTVAGRRVVVNGQPFTIAGVVPEAFQGVYALVEFDAYLPLSMLPTDQYRDMVAKRDQHSLHVIGRLAPGVSRAQGQAAIDVQARQLESKYPDTTRPCAPG